MKMVFLQFIQLKNLEKHSLLVLGHLKLNTQKIGFHRKILISMVEKLLLKSLMNRLPFLIES